MSTILSIETYGMMLSNGSYLEIVKILLADGRVDPRAGGNYAVRVARHNRHLQILQVLKEYYYHRGWRWLWEAIFVRSLVRELGPVRALD